jgi:hypothetical protein
MKTRTNISFPHHKKIHQIGIASGFALGCLPSSVAAVQTPALGTSLDRPRGFNCSTAKY